MLRKVVSGLALVGMFALGLLAGRTGGVQAQTANHLFEVRIYTAGEGKLDAVVKRFRDPEVGLFDKYGMKAVLYSTISEPTERQNQFVYVLQHDSREAARESWAKFLADPEFRAAAAASNEGGRAVVSVESFFVEPTDFSPLK